MSWGGGPYGYRVTIAMMDWRSRFVQICVYVWVGVGIGDDTKGCVHLGVKDTTVLERQTFERHLVFISVFPTDPGQCNQHGPSIQSIGLGGEKRGLLSGCEAQDPIPIPCPIDSTSTSDPGWTGHGINSAWCLGFDAMLAIVGCCRGSANVR